MDEPSKHWAYCFELLRVLVYTSFEHRKLGISISESKHTFLARYATLSDLISAAAVKNRKMPNAQPDRTNLPVVIYVTEDGRQICGHGPRIKASQTRGRMCRRFQDPLFLISLSISENANTSSNLYKSELAVLQYGISQLAQFKLKACCSPSTPQPQNYLHAAKLKLKLPYKMI